MPAKRRCQPRDGASDEKTRAVRQATISATGRRRVRERQRPSPWLDTVQALGHRFREDRLALTAGGLTFTSVISLVPLVTVTLALLTVFPMFASLQQTLRRYFVTALVPDAIAEPVLEAVTQFSGRASQLGAAGLMALLVSAIALMLTIDRALNVIWRVRRPRPIGQRVLVYWAAITLGPLLLGLSVTASSYALSASRGYLGPVPQGIGVVLGGLEFAAVALAVAALFHYVPNTHVRWRHAFLGGVLVAVGFIGAKRLLTLYFGNLSTFAMVYGAFATLPIFLVWIYLTWVIVLLGAVIAAYAPVAGAPLRRWRDLPGSRLHLALSIVRVLSEAKADGENALRAEAIAKRLGTDPLQIEPLLEQLAEIDWVGRLDEAGAARHALLCDPSGTPAEPLLAALLIEPAPDLAPLWHAARFDVLTLAAILPVDVDPTDVSQTTPPTRAHR